MPWNCRNKLISCFLVENKNEYMNILEIVYDLFEETIFVRLILMQSYFTFLAHCLALMAKFLLCSPRH